MWVLTGSTCRSTRSAPGTFRTLTHRDRLPDGVPAGLAAAMRRGLSPREGERRAVRGINEAEAPDLLRFCLDHGYQLRFIEQMPLDAQHGWRRENMVTAEEILTSLSSRFTLTPDDPSQRGSAPAESFLVDGGPARVGIIGSVTRPFCGSCDRVRLTASSQLRNCPVARAESDCAARCAQGQRRRTRGSVAPLGRGQTSWPRHERPTFLQPDRPMSAIGG